MAPIQWVAVVVLLAAFHSIESYPCRRNPDGKAVVRKRYKYMPEISVSLSGKANFSKIQDAIDSVPAGNARWISIDVKPGTYREQIIIPYNKPFIYLKGAGKRRTFVMWGDYGNIATSATFNSQADNIAVKSMTFINSYNYPPQLSNNAVKPAVAALIQGDKSVFYRCGFLGFQDTLWDAMGRHYFRMCTIEGAVDFIFGAAQSLYEKCSIKVNAGAGDLLHGAVGYITAQGRSKHEETNGFVFKNCNITGNGKTYLGRPWRDYARVVFYSTNMSPVVVPRGWDAWKTVGREYQLTFAEYDSQGRGSDNSGRVSWANRVDYNVMRSLASYSFIDKEGWLGSNYTELNMFVPSSH